MARRARAKVGRVRTDRLSVALGAMAEVGGDGQLSMVDRVCAAAVAVLSLRGAGLSLMVDGELRGTAGVSDPGIAAVQELQLSLGEGPCVDAWVNGDPVLEPDLAAPAVVRWPAFAVPSVEAGARAVFAFPLRLGAIRIGGAGALPGPPGCVECRRAGAGTRVGRCGHPADPWRAGRRPTR